MLRIAPRTPRTHGHTHTHTQGFDSGRRLTVPSTQRVGLPARFRSHSPFSSESCSENKQTFVRLLSADMQTPAAGFIHRLVNHAYFPENDPTEKGQHFHLHFMLLEDRLLLWIQLNRFIKSEEKCVEKHQNFWVSQSYLNNQKSEMSWLEFFIFISARDVHDWLFLRLTFTILINQSSLVFFLALQIPQWLLRSVEVVDQLMVNKEYWTCVTANGYG